MDGLGASPPSISKGSFILITQSKHFAYYQTPRRHCHISLFLILGVPLGGPALPVGVNDATTFVQEGTENEERTITNNRVKVKVRDRDNVLMSAVAGQMEGDVRYVPIFFESLLDSFHENYLSD